MKSGIHQQHANGHKSIKKNIETTRENIKTAKEYIMERYREQMEAVGRRIVGLVHGSKMGNVISMLLRDDIHYFKLFAPAFQLQLTQSCSVSLLDGLSFLLHVAFSFASNF